MEDGWQMKCGVNFPGSSSRVTTNATSEQIYLHEARNQMNMNLSHCILPLDVREQGPLSPQMKQAPASHVLNFSSRKPIQLESGSAVHSLLSASPSLSQCDFQRQLNMHFSSGGCIPDTSYPNNVGTMPTWPLLQNRKNLNARAGVDVYPVSRPIMNSNNGCSHGPSDNLDALKAFITYPCSRNESEINTSLEKGVTSASSSSSNLQDTSLQTSSSVAMKRNGVASGCPRVFCLGACGDLLLSNTGLFGILCSCHGMHMSVSKFCEHAGLSNVNPGYAVRMDSGESIAQWRKVYLQKFGIRAPGDHRGWDWPEGLLATSGLANSSMVVADRRKDFDMSSLFNSPAESSTQPQNNASISRPRSTQTFSNQILKNAQIRNGCDHSNMEISRRNSCNMTDNPKIACPSLINCDNEGSGDGCVSRPFHFIPYCENSFSSAFHNLQSVDSKASNNSKDEIVLKRGPITSSIELKLGQPSQLSRGSGSVVLTSVRPHTSGVRTSTVQEKLNHNFENISEKNKQRISCQSASDFSRVLESFQGGPLNSAPTSSMESPGNNLLISSNGSVHVENLKKELHYSSGFSVPVSPSNIIARGSLYHKEINNRMTDSHPFNHWTLHQPHVTRSVIDLSYNGDAPIWPLDVNKSALPNNIGRSMDATCGYEGSNEGSSRLYAKQMESSGFARNKNSCNPNNSALSAAKFNLRGLTDMVPGVSGSSNIVRNACNPASNLDRDQFSNKLNSSSFSFTTPTLQVTSSGFTPLYTVLDPGHDSVSFSKDVEAVSNENLKLHALRNVDISFKNIPMDSPLVFDQWTRIHSEQRQENKNCTISDLRAQGFFPDQGPFEGQGHGRPFCNGQIVVPSFLLDADHKKGVNLGANSEEITIPSELIDKYNVDPCDPQPKKLSSLSVGRRENLESDCNMVQRCNGGSSFLISARCNYNVQTVCSRREQENKDSSSMYGFKEQASIAVVETPKYNSSAISEDCISIEKEIPVECHGKENEQKSKLDWGNFQWTDVPSKKTKVSKVRCPDAPTYLLDTKEETEANLKELAAEDTSRLNQAAELLLVKELSEISSGCSVPAVTQASNEVNMIDSGTVDGGQTVYNKDLVADQESAISTSSSVEGIDSLRSLQLVCDGKIISTDEKSSTMFENEAHHGVINEFKRSCSKSNELQTFGGKFSEVSNKAQNDYGFKPRKRKRITKWKTLGTSFAVSSHCAPKDVQLLLQSNQNSSKILNIKSSEKILERRRPAMFSARMPSRKRALRGMCNILEGDPSDERLLKGNDDSIDMPENAVTKKYKHVDPAAAVKATVAVKGYWLPKSISNRNLKCSSKGCQVVKPVACGKYGIICDQELDIDQIKPPKIVPLSQVLKASKRHVKFEKEPVLPSMRKRNNIRCNSGRKPHDVPFCSHRGQGNRCSKGLSFHSSEDSSIQETQQIHMDNTQSDDADVFVEGSAGVDIRNLSISTSPDSVSKTKELRMRSLYELSMRGNKFISADISRSQNVMCAPSTECRLEMTTPVDARKSDGDERGGSGRRSCRKLPFSSLMPEKDKLCCVCGISNKDIANCLLECGHCSIQIHQACYGISRVPKGDWYCRPCRTNSKDVACVLCGYGGGAMTRAFGSRNVVKSLLKAWDIRTEPHIMSVGSAEALYVPAKMERRNTMDSEGCQPCPLIKPVVHNSIISGLFDPTVKQWVHMVCGLWTPGTRCPNVDTMSAFDVSGVSLLKEYMVCYMCNRAGGSCIRCSVEKCCTHFHPWCAHQKGLLQSEVEGVDKDQIGFYGRCLLHAKSRACYLENDNDTDKAYSEIEQEKEPTCARTVGYKGKTQGDGGNYSSYQHSGKGGCLVTQVQVDAWLYINRHKLSRNKQPKPPVLDVDHDYRKEYARYKQAKGWKHLVVYKSGIHALGLYTSQFFQRGAMVVEYIGEIVGHRVADKREAEYLSGRKYKSACYFFRIDKEQIIDATCRGGIARFVNHSCQPNCAAKVLTIRGEKKVVFFAQRDIYPGEEITYDYHFNREDEGKKIPCFCNSGNCRRYLN